MANPYSRKSQRQAKRSGAFESLRSTSHNNNCGNPNWYFEKVFDASVVSCNLITWQKAAWLPYTLFVLLLSWSTPRRLKGWAGYGGSEYRPIVLGRAWLAPLGRVECCTTCRYRGWDSVDGERSAPTRLSRSEKTLWLSGPLFDGGRAMGASEYSRTGIIGWAAAFWIPLPQSSYGIFSVHWLTLSLL